MSLYRCSIEYQVGGEGCVNVVFIDDGAGGSGAESLVGKLKTDWCGSLAPALGAAMSFTKLVAVEVVRFGSQDAYEEGVNIGGNPSFGMPDAPQLAVCCPIRTGFHGRTRRGRFFLSGIPDAYVENGRITATGQTALETAFEDLTEKWVGESATSGFRLGVFSRERYKILSNPFDDYWKPATSVSFQTIMSTMRSRKPTS